MCYHVNFHIKHKSILDDIKDFLLGRIEHEYLFYFSNFVVKIVVFWFLTLVSINILFKRLQFKYES